MFSPRSVTQSALVGNTSVSFSIDPNDPLVHLLLLGGTQTDIVHIRIGAGPQTATAADFPVIEGIAVVIPAYAGADTLAAINPGAGSDTLYVTTGHDV